MVQDPDNARKPSYWVAAVLGGLVLVWIVIETIFAGFTENLAGASETVFEHGAAIITAVTSLLAGIFALRNYIPKDDKIKPPGTEQGMP